MFHQMDGGYMWFGWIFWLILISVIIWAVVTLVNRTRDRSLNPPANETPLDILKKRYAKGELTKDQFEEMKKTLGT